jgi:trimeric autotransporter adhesin
MKLQTTCFAWSAILALMAPTAWAQSNPAIPSAGVSTVTQTSQTETITRTSGTGTQTTSNTQTTSAGTQTTSTGQSTTGTGTQTTTTSTGAFQNLSPGNQRIAQALFNAQHPPAGTQALTLDQIATMKGGEGWGRVFKDMKTDGLVQARNLGQVVSGHAQSASNTAAITSAGATSTAGSRQVSAGGHQTSTGSRTPIVITNGAGRTVAVSGVGSRGGGRYASNTPTHITTGSGASSRITTGSGVSTNATGGTHGGNSAGHGHAR